MPRVLIAEDEAAIADAVLYALRSEGIEADHCLLAREVAPRVRAGGVDVVVPDGVNVRNETIAIFGGSDVKNITPAPGGPTIVLKGLVMFGGIDAKGKQRRR